MKSQQLEDIDVEVKGLKVIGMDDERVRWVEKDGKRVDLEDGDDIKDKLKDLK